MEDAGIIDLYFQRDETAIRETDAKYGAFCRKIAFSILSSSEDAEECVNDAYLKVWHSIPPQIPDCFKVWLGRIIRNISLDLWRKNHRQKRFSGMEQLFDELAECIPSPESIDTVLEGAELTQFLNRWLEALPREDRVVFIRRYWYGESVRDLAALCRTSPLRLANRTCYLRKKLKAAFKKEGITL